MDGNTEHLSTETAHTAAVLEWSPATSGRCIDYRNVRRTLASLIPVNFDISTGTGTGTPALAKLTPFCVFCFVRPCRDCTPTRVHTPTATYVSELQSSSGSRDRERPGDSREPRSYSTVFRPPERLLWHVHELARSLVILFSNILRDKRTQHHDYYYRVSMDR